MKNLTILSLGLLALALPATASSQLPQASAAALGMGENMTASARGFAAVANNPAGLGHPSSPGFSLAIPAVVAEAGVGPVTLSDLVDWEGTLVPVNIKEDWLSRIASAGGQSGTVGAGATPVALSIGAIGFQMSTRVGGATSLAPDAAELLLFGNAGRTGSARDFTLDDSFVEAYALTTVAVSYGLQASDRIYLGATGKYVIGNGLLVGRDAGSVASSNPIAVEVDFPVLLPYGESDDFRFNHGSGIGLDVGGLWVGPALTVGATIENLFNTFSWNLDEYSYLPGEAFFNSDTSTSNFEEQPLASATPAAQAAFQALADDLTLKPIVAVGVELTPTPILRLQADIRKTLGDGLEFDPNFHMGVGAEVTALSFLPLRAHVGLISEGVQVGGGSSLILGPVNLSGAIALRARDSQNSTLGMVTLSFGAN